MLKALIVLGELKQSVKLGTEDTQSKHEAISFNESHLYDIISLDMYIRRI